MTLHRVALAALVGTAVVATASASQPAERPAAVPPTATAVVVQAPAACRAGTAPVASPIAGVPAAARRLVTAGADLSVVCDAADATAAVVGAASGHDAVLGTGPDVRAALALAAADHPAQRFGPLPAR